MRKLSLFLLVAISALFVGCQKDIIGEPEEISKINVEPLELKLGNVSGIIIDQNYNPIEGATIKFNLEDYTSDINGYFKILATGAFENGGVLTVIKNGYFDNFKFVFIENNETSHIRVQMVEKSNPSNLNAISGGKVDIKNGGSVTFPTRAFVDQKKVSYEGNVQVYTHWYNPTDRNLELSMPGDLRALNNNGKIQQLTTYGMMAVEILTPNGQELELAPGVTATLSFPIPDQLKGNAPAEIATWSLNEETVYWEEESTAEIVDGNYIAEVSHFSFWNCDIPSLYIKLKGKVVDTNGDPLPWYRVLVIAESLNQSGSGCTNSNGKFCGFVPKNQPLFIQIKDECGNVIYEESIGPFNAMTDLGEIVISGNTNFIVKGRLTCMGMAITNGYAKIKLDNGVYYIAEIDQNGNFELAIESCEVNSLTVQGFDLANARISEIVEITSISGDEIIIPPFEVCEELDEYIIYKIGNSQEVLIQDPNAGIFDGDLVINGILDSLSNYITLKGLDVSISSNLSVQFLDAYLFGINNLVYQVDCGLEGLGGCELVNLEIKVLGQKGEFVEGSFMGEANGSQGEIETIMGSFRIEIDYIGNYGSINGQVWNDANNDGIRQANESAVPNVTISLILPFGFQISVKTDIEGKYNFDDITNSEFELSVQFPGGYNLGKANQGNDDAIDSDFENRSTSISLGYGETLNNFDLALIPSGNLGCEVDINEYPVCIDENSTASIIVYAFGQAPYSVSLNGVQLTSFDEDFIIISDLILTEYFIELSDAIGNTCTTEITLSAIDAFGCFITSTDAVTGQENGTATVNTVTSQAQSYLWSNGANTSTIVDLAPGNYSVTATDINGCTAECSTTISESNFSCEIIGSEILCSGGSSILFVETNLSDVTFEWSNGSTDQEIIITDQGQYSVTVTSSVGQTSSCELVVVEFQELSCDIETSDTQCGFESGTAIVSVTGGSGFYSYIWSNGETSQINTKLGPGTYTVEVIDNVNGCTTECIGTVGDIPLTCNVTLDDIACNENFGTLRVYPPPGVGNPNTYTYEWSTGSTEKFITDLAEGVYSVTITNEFGCTGVCEGIVEIPDPIEVNVQIITEVCENDETVSTLTAEVSGGSGMYTYFWSEGSFGSTITTNQQGFLELTVTDDEGCISTTEIEVGLSASKVGNKVWVESGNSDPDVYNVGQDLGIQNVKVYLFDAIDLMNLVAIDSTLTNEFGDYLFEHLSEGNYMIGINLPADYQFVNMDIGGNEEIDSDFNTTTGRSDVFELTGDACSLRLDIDAGLILE